MGFLFKKFGSKLCCICANKAKENLVDWKMAGDLTHEEFPIKSLNYKSLTLQNHKTILLKKYKYPPEQAKEALEIVMKQVELVCSNEVATYEGMV